MTKEKIGAPELFLEYMKICGPSRCEYVSLPLLISGLKPATSRDYFDSVVHVTRRILSQPIFVERMKESPEVGVLVPLGPLCH